MLADNPYLPRFSKEEMARRHSMVRAAMEERGLDCLVIYGGDRGGGTDLGQPNAVYLSNYVGLSTSYVIVPARAEPTLIVRFELYVHNGQEIGAIEDVRHSGYASEASVANRLKELGLERGRIGLVGSGVIDPSFSIPHEHFQHLQATFPNATFENVSGWYEDLRLVKSDEEIAVMERAGRLVSLAYEEMILSTRPGMKHAALRRVVESAALRLGGMHAYCIMGSGPMDGPEMPLPDALPSDRTIENGHVVFAELPLGFGTYSVKIMGTYFMGKPTDLYRQMFDIAAEVYHRGVEGLKPGMTGRDVQQFLTPIKDAGFTTHGPMIMGWATYNERPRVGTLGAAHAAMNAVEADLDLVFKPGMCLHIAGRVATPDLTAGLWVGAGGVLTESGLRMFVTHPVDQLRVL